MTSEPHVRLTVQLIERTAVAASGSPGGERATVMRFDVTPGDRVIVAGGRSHVMRQCDGAAGDGDSPLRPTQR